MPLYHRPESLPPIPMNHAGPVPFFLKPAAPRRKLNSVELPKPKKPVHYSSQLAGVGAALLFFLGLIVVALAASVMWNSPYRSWFWGGLGLATAIGILTTAKACVGGDYRHGGR